jgi:hypothetical protein
MPAGFGSADRKPKLSQRLRPHERHSCEVDREMTIHAVWVGIRTKSFEIKIGE